MRNKCTQCLIKCVNTLPTAEILSGKNAWAWVSMVLYFKKVNEN